MKILNISEGTVRNLVQSGELKKPRKVAGRIARWFMEDIEEYLSRLKYQEGVDPEPAKKKIFDSKEPQGASRRRKEPQKLPDEETGS